MSTYEQLLLTVVGGVFLLIAFSKYNYNITNSQSINPNFMSIVTKTTPVISASTSVSIKTTTSRSITKTPKTRVNHSQSIKSLVRSSEQMHPGHTHVHVYTGNDYNQLITSLLQLTKYNSLYDLQHAVTSVKYWQEPTRQFRDLTINGYKCQINSICLPVEIQNQGQIYVIGGCYYLTSNTQYGDYVPFSNNFCS